MEGGCRVEVSEDQPEGQAQDVELDSRFAEEKFEYVEPPPEDFFCPVTFELLLEPHQTTCCGHHLSEKAVDRLRREGKPCPVCKETNLVVMPDKFFKRKVSSIRIRCLNEQKGCEWVGEVGGSKQHFDSCPKRPWHCQYCNFKATFEDGVKHTEECSKYPTPCPNKCEVGTVPRCDIEKHHAECPLEPVACELADIGCDVKVARRDLSRHMEESQQQHLLSTSLLNIKLMRETIAEKDHLLMEMKQKIEEQALLLVEKNLQLAERDHQLNEKEHQIAEKKDQLAEKDKIIAMKDGQLLEVLVQLQQDVLASNLAIHQLSRHKFTLENFSQWQKKDTYGDWFSEPFSCSQRYKLRLNVETKERGTHLTIRLNDFYDKAKGKVFIFTLQMLNQQGNHGHHLRRFRTTANCTKFRDYSEAYDYIEFKRLYKGNKSVRYLKNDCLKFVLLIKEE